MDYLKLIEEEIKNTPYENMENDFVFEVDGDNYCLSDMYLCEDELYLIAHDFDDTIHNNHMVKKFIKDHNEELNGLYSVTLDLSFFGKENLTYYYK